MSLHNTNGYYLFLIVFKGHSTQKKGHKNDTTVPLTTILVAIFLNFDLVRETMPQCSRMYLWQIWLQRIGCQSMMESLVKSVLPYEKVCTDW